MAPGLVTVLTYPVYRLLYSAATIQGAACSLYFYWPGFKKWRTIPEMEKSGDPQCFYFNDRFVADLGFLANMPRKGPPDEDYFTVLTESLHTKDIADELASSPASTLSCSQDAV